MSMRSEFRRPRWILLAVGITLFTVAAVSLGFWQLRRLDERRMYNDIVSSRLDRPAVGIDDVRSERAAGPHVPASDFEFLVLNVTGTFTDEGRVQVRSQVHNSQAGTHVVVPMELEDGTGILVNLGWIPLGAEPPSVLDLFGPDPVMIQGLLRPSQLRPAFGQQEPTGELVTVARIDIDRIQQQVSLPLEDFWIQLTEPMVDGAPVLARIPELDEGSHFWYAIQWFSFALIAIVTYLAMVRREVMRLRRAQTPSRDQ